LPDYLKAFVDGEIDGLRHTSASAFLFHLVQQAYMRKHSDRIDKLLLEGLNSGPATPMTKEDWAGIRQRISERLGK
jgi:antitoxin ParD1/3/4